MVDGSRQASPVPDALIAAPGRGFSVHLIGRTRRLQDIILLAVHRACDHGNLNIASRLLRLGEEVVEREPDLRRRRQALGVLVAAHERLWHLRNPDMA